MTLKVDIYGKSHWFMIVWAPGVSLGVFLRWWRNDMLCKRRHGKTFSFSTWERANSGFFEFGSKHVRFWLCFREVSSSVSTTVLYMFWLEQLNNSKSFHCFPSWFSIFFRISQVDSHSVLVTLKFDMGGKTEWFMVVWAPGVFLGVFLGRWRKDMLCKRRQGKTFSFSTWERANSGLFFGFGSQHVRTWLCFERFLRQYPQQFYTCLGLSSSTVLGVFIVFIFGWAAFVWQFPHSSFSFARALFRWAKLRSLLVAMLGCFFCIVVAGMVSSARHGLAVAKNLWVHIAIVQFGL